MLKAFSRIHIERIDAGLNMTNPQYTIKLSHKVSITNG